MRGGLLLLLLLMAKARMVSVDGSKNMRILVNEDPGHELVDLCALTLLIVYPSLPLVEINCRSMISCVVCRCVSQQIDSLDSMLAAALTKFEKIDSTLHIAL